MRQRTAMKTGRTAAMQVGALIDRAFSGKTARTLGAWVLAGALSAAAFGAGDSAAQAKPASADAAITLQVQETIARDPLLGSMRIEVETHGRVVHLTGFVRSLQDIAKAGELARAVRGVSAVSNGLRLQDRPSRA